MRWGRGFGGEGEEESERWLMGWMVDGMDGWL